MKSFKLSLAMLGALVFAGLLLSHTKSYSRPLSAFSEWGLDS